MDYFYYYRIDCFVILQGTTSLEENNQDSFRAKIPTAPVTTFVFGTPNCVPRSSYKRYICWFIVL